MILHHFSFCLPLIVLAEHPAKYLCYELAHLAHAQAAIAAGVGNWDWGLLAAFLARVSTMVLLGLWGNRRIVFGPGFSAQLQGQSLVWQPDFSGSDVPGPFQD